MGRKIILDAYEQEIEDNFESLKSVPNLEEEMAKIKKAASEHLKRKESVKLKIPESDLETIKIKASKLGISYQIYIRMLIHKGSRNLS